MTSTAGLSFGLPWWAWLLALLAATGATWLAYGYRRQLLAEWPLWLRYLLPALRFVAVLLVALLLLEPVWNQVREQRQPARVALLLDGTRSITAGSDSATLQAQLVPGIRRVQERLANAGVAVDLYRFGNRLSPLVRPDSLQFVAGSTNLAAALDEVASRYWDRNLAATVLVTDGIATTGGSPVYAAEALPAPVFAAWVGDTSLRRDIRIETVEANSVSYRDAETPLRIHLRADGFGQQTLGVRVVQGNTTLAQGNVAIRNGQTGVLDLNIKLTTPGLQAVDIVADSRPGERTYRNNRSRLYLRVLETRQRIVLLAGAPHPDIGALQAAFADKRYQLTLGIHKTETTFYSALPDSAIAQADLVILHNFPASGADRPVMEQLAQAVRRTSVPVWTLYGTGTLENVHPQQGEIIGLTAPAGVSRRAAEAELALEPAYRQHATYTFDEAFARWQDNNPPLLVPDATWNLASGSTLYGTQRIKGYQLQRPMFVLREVPGANRKSVVLLGENLWRWRIQAFAQSGDARWFDGWVQALAQWLVLRQDRRAFRVAPAQPLFGPSDPVLLKGQVFDELYKPLAGVEVVAEVLDSAGRSQRHVLLPGAAGNYSAQLPPLAEGTYRYRATGTREGKEIGRDAGTFTVGPSTEEFRNLRADAPLLQQVALRTGGVSLPATQLDALTDSLLALPGLKPVVSYRTEATPAHRLWLPLLLVLALLTTEWVLRKRFGTV